MGYSTTKSQGRKHSLDKFYTKPLVAKICINSVDLTQYTYVIEPSAGNGSFSTQIPNCIALDIDPENESITQQDFLRYERTRHETEKTLVIGNPPFGQQNSLAIRFINHAAAFADTVAFILPVTFKKQSIQNKIALNLTLFTEYEIQSKAFLLNDEEYTVPCIFQIWKHTPGYSRALTPNKISSTIHFVKKNENPDFALQRIGGNAGKASTDHANKSDQSHYFMKLDNKNVTPLEIQAFVDTINATEFPTRDWGVGPRSISKQEIINVIG